MRKTLVLTLILAMCIILGAAGDTEAIDDIGFGGGTILMMEQGKTSTFGYYAKGRFPWGIEKTSITSINQHVADTNVTFEILTELMVVYSDFEYDKYGETEAEVIVTKIRKSLDVMGAYLEGGLTVWHQRGASVGDEAVENLTRDGYYIGLGFEPVKDVKLDLGSHIIPVSDGTDVFALNLGFQLIL